MRVWVPVLGSTSHRRAAHAASGPVTVTDARRTGPPMIVALVPPSASGGNVHAATPGSVVTGMRTQLLDEPSTESTAVDPARGSLATASGPGALALEVVAVPPAASVTTCPAGCCGSDPVTRPLIVSAWYVRDGDDGWLTMVNLMGPSICRSCGCWIKHSNDLTSSRCCWAIVAWLK